jgi:hypothetical protein
MYPSLILLQGLICQSWFQKQFIERINNTTCKNIRTEKHRTNLFVWYNYWTTSTGFTVNQQEALFRTIKVKSITVVQYLVLECSRCLSFSKRLPDVTVKWEKLHKESSITVTSRLEEIDYFWVGGDSVRFSNTANCANTYTELNKQKWSSWKVISQLNNQTKFRWKATLCRIMNDAVASYTCRKKYIKKDIVWTIDL